MNKFKKILTGIVVAAGISCLGGAVACAETQPNYYSLSFEGSGLDYIMQGDLAVPDENGNSFRYGTVKEGVEVRFKVLLGGNTSGVPKIVLGNGEEIFPDADGVYSFIMSGNTVVKAEGLSKLVSVNLHKGEKAGTDITGAAVYAERRFSYIGEDGKELDDVVKLVEGGSLKFKLKISPYYKKTKIEDGKEVPAYSLLNGAEELIPDANGYYTLTDVKGDKLGEQHLSIMGLEEEDAFFVRGDCGTGTAADPYLISRPIDLYNVAAFVNANSYRMNTAHYKLTEDIDMEGEELFIIGKTDSAVFSGVFDGNGKTISNFYITDEDVDTEDNYKRIYRTGVGLFGYAVATIPTGDSAGGPVEVKNLNLDNYRILAHPEKSGQSATYIGSIAGNSIGLQITNCSVTNGTVLVEGDNSSAVFMGGMVGFMQAGYHTASGTAYDTYVQSSHTDVYMDGRGLPRASGGIVGYLVSSASNATANVVNCYATGDIDGGMHAGGVVGLLGRYSAVSNCYATGEIYSGNNLGASALESARYAYAGGIVGYAYDDTVITNCYSANSLVEAYSTSGANYQGHGEILGGYSTERSSADSCFAIEFNNKSKKGGDAFDAAVLGWSDKDWNLEGATADKLPTINYSAANREITILIKGGGADISKGKTVSGYLPAIHSWYGEADVNLNEFFNVGNNRTYGYYLDEDCTLRVPYGYVPASEQTILYVNLADYTQVAGTYYLLSDGYTTAASFELTANGNVYFRQGGMSFNGVYSYDGEKIVMYNTCFANLSYDVIQVSGQHFSLVGTKTADGGFDLYGIALNLIDTVNSTDKEIAYFDAELNYKAIKKNETFKFGEYVTVDGKGKYTFLENMTGIYRDDDGAVQFTFTVTDTAVEMSYFNASNQKVTWLGTVANGTVTTLRQVGVNKNDEYAGKWTKSANSGVSFTFDGQGFVTVSVFGSEDVNVGYTSAADKITFLDYEAFIDANTGALVVNGENYYRGTGVTGSWYMPGIDERVDVTFEGLGADGYGYANIFYAGNAVLSLDAQYDVTEYADGTVIRLFVGDELFGELNLTDNYDAVTGSFFSYNQQGYYQNASLYLYDNFQGTWTSNVEGIDSAKFNGKNANGKGEVTFGSSSKRYTYTLTDAFNGTVKVSEEVTYQIAYDEATGKVSVQVSDSANGQFARRDSWYGVELQDGDGKTYTFDGKGYIGGTVTVKNGGSETTLPYTVEVDGTVKMDGKTLTATADGYTDGTLNLTFNTGFEGVWLISGTGKTLTVSEVGGGFNAKVSYDGSEQYDFKYNPATSTLSYIYEDEIGTRLTATLKLTVSKTELSIIRTGGNGELNLLCIQNSQADDFMGLYTAENGSWYFDGLGKSVYGSGKAVLTSGGTETAYSYKINILNVPVITIGQHRYGFMTVQEGGYKKQGEDTGYSLIELDELNGVTAKMEDVNYVFDGVSTVYRMSGDTLTEIYKYKAISSEEADLKDAGGNKYLATVTKRGMSNIMELTAYGTLYTDREVGLIIEDAAGNQEEEFYVFKADGKFYKKGEDGKEDVAVYEYTVVSAYEVTLREIESGNEYVGTMKKYTISSGVVTRIKLQNPEDVAED